MQSRVAFLFLAAMLSILSPMDVLAFGTEPNGEPLPDGVKEKSAPPRKDRHGDALPQGAVARLGTVRFHNPQPIHTVAFAPDGKELLVFAHEYPNSALRFWNIADGKELARFALKDAKYPEAWYTRAACFTPDGTGIVLRREEIVELLDRRSGKSRHVLNGKDKFRAMGISPDGKVAALAAPEAKKTTIIFWEMATGKMRSPLTIDSDWFFGLHYSSDGKRLLTASADQKRRGIVQVWDVGSGKMLHEVAVDNYFYVAFSPDGRFVASRHDSGYRGPGVDPKDEIRVLRVDDGATVCRFKPPPNGSWASFAFTPDGKALIAIAPGHTPTLWDAATGKKIHVFAGPPAKSVAMGGFSADGKRFALIVGNWMRENAVRFWNVETGEEIRPYDGHADEVTAIAYSPDGKILASGSYDCSIRLWDPGTGRELRCVQGHKERVLALAFSPGGGTLASASADGTTRLWKVADGRELAKLDGPGRPGAAPSGWFEREGMKLAFAADAKALFAIDGQVSYCAWDVATGRTLKRKTFGDDENRLIGLSADGGTTITYSRKHSEKGQIPEALGLWNVETGQRERTLPRRLFEKKTHDMACVEAEMSRDGRLLAGSSRAITDFSPLSPLYGYPALRIWERLSGQEILRLDTFPKALAFSFDGKLIAGNEASSDPHGYDFWHDHMGSVYLWDTTTGKRRQEFAHHTAEVRCIAFASDGKTVASGSADHTVLIWDCSRSFADEKPLPEPLAKQLDAWWESLADGNAVAARRAMAQLVRRPAAANKLLRERLKPATAPDPIQLAALVRDLSSPQFATRHGATENLVRFGDAALPILNKAMAAIPDLEAMRRLEHVFSRATDVGHRKLRAVAVLEAIADDGAVRVLESLAKGVPESRQTLEAQVALRRLGR